MFYHIIMKNFKSNLKNYILFFVSNILAIAELFAFWGLIIPEPILNPLHPHEDVNCKLIDVETGDYSEFKMNVDASINRCQDYTVWQKKGIDDYFYSLVRLKNKQQRKN